MATPIQEYLIALGFKLDDPAYKRFRDTLDGTAKDFIGIAEKATAAATAVGLAVEKIASNYEDLYYLSQRTGSSIQALQGTAFGFTQVGLAAGDAKSLVDSLATSLRFNPGTGTVLRMIGVSPSGDANVDMMAALHRLVHMNPILAQGYGGMLNITPQQLMMFSLPHALEDIEAASKDVGRRLGGSGVDSGQLGYDAKVFMNDLRKLEDEFGILGAKIAQDWIKPADNIINQIEVMTEKFLAFDVSVDGAATKIGALVGAFGGIAALKGTLSWLFGKGASGGTAAAGGAAATGFGWLGGLVAATLDWGDASGNAGVAAVRKQLDAERGLSNNPADVLRDLGASGGGQAGVTGQAGWWTSERQQHAIQMLVAGGVSPLGAAALVSRWMNVESAGGPGSVNPTSGAFGIGQWLGARKPGIAGDTDFDHQLAYVLRELHSSEGSALGALNSASTPWDAARGASMYERAHGYNSALGTDDFTGRTAAGISIGAPNTTIHVTGGADPQTTADYVLKGQLGVWDDVFRHAGTGVR